MVFIFALGVILILLIQGIGFAVWVNKGKDYINLYQIITQGIWFGFIAIFLFDIIVYYSIGTLSIRSIALIESVVVTPVSLALLKKYKARKYAWSWEYILPVFAASLSLVINIKPMWNTRSLSYYFLNNGEFSNYSLLADAMKFNSRSFNPGGPFGTESREAVTSILISHFSSIFNIPTIWITQVLAATLLSLTVLLLGTAIFSTIQSKRTTTVNTATGILLTCFAINASTQVFWTLSFFSQYSSIFIVVGLFAFLQSDSTSEVDEYVKRFVICMVSLLLLVAVYPEMFLVNFTIFAIYTIFQESETRPKSFVRRCWLIPLYFCMVYIFSPTKFVYERSSPTTGGWDIFGSYDQLAKFVGNLVGITSPFLTENQSLPRISTFLSVIIILTIFTFSKNSRSLLPRNITAIYFAYFALIPLIVAYMKFNDLNTNFMLMKYVIGFVWIPYFAISANVISRERIAFPLILLISILSIGLLARTSEMTERYLNGKVPEIFLKSEADRFREQFQNVRFCDSTSFMNRFELFIRFRENIFANRRSWPAYTPERIDFTPSSDCHLLIIGNINNYEPSNRVYDDYIVQYSKNGFQIYSPNK